MTQEPVLLSVDYGVAFVTLNRPEVLNGLDLPTLDILNPMLEKLGRDSDVRVVVITGAGKAFCAGGDLNAFKKGLNRNPGFFGILLTKLHQLLRIVRGIPKPVIAAVNGVAAGGGLGLALACDIRIASKKAKFRPAFTTTGIVPGDAVGYLLPKIVGVGNASWMLMADEPVPAERAMEMGLVSAVYPTESFTEETVNLAIKLAKGPPVNYAGSKKLTNRSSFLDLDEYLKLEMVLFVASSRTADFREGVEAFLAKREPEFSGK